MEAYSGYQSVSMFIFDIECYKIIWQRPYATTTTKNNKSDIYSNRLDQRYYKYNSTIHAYLLGYLDEFLDREGIQLGSSANGLDMIPHRRTCIL